MTGLLAGGVMKFDLPVTAAFLFAGAVALSGCENSTTSGSISGGLGPSTGATTGTTPGTTTGTGTGPSGQPVLVRLGTDNLVESDPPTYKKLWVAIVSDTAGNPVGGATVIFAMRSGTASNPGGFLKGRYVLPPPAPAPQLWTQSISAGCANEDANFNSILDPGEDLNGNGLLDPPGVAAVNTVGITDASGIAQATITYPKNYATWAELTLEARSGAGTPATATFFLVGLATDYSDLNVAPPGAISPFGESGNCADTL
jgi:hypothetical protein